MLKRILEYLLIICLFQGNTKGKQIIASSDVAVAAGKLHNNLLRNIKDYEETLLS